MQRVEQKLNELLERYNTSIVREVLDGKDVSFLESYLEEQEEFRVQCSKLFKKKVSEEELRAMNPELGDEEMAELLKGQKKTKKDIKKDESDAKKAAKKAEMEAKKEAKKAEMEAKRAAKKEEMEAKKAAKKAESEAKKEAKKLERKNQAAERKEMKQAEKDSAGLVLESFARDTNILKSTIKRASNPENLVKEMQVLSLQVPEYSNSDFEDTPATIRRSPESQCETPNDTNSQELQVTQQATQQETQQYTQVFQEPMTPESPPVQPEIPTDTNSQELQETQQATQQATQQETQQDTQVFQEPMTPDPLPEKVVVEAVGAKVEKKSRYVKETLGGIDMIIDRENTKKANKNYYLREGRCYTSSKLVGKWNEAENTVDFYNLEPDDVKPIKMTNVEFNGEKTSRKFYLDVDCTVYLDSDGDSVGRYNAKTHVIEPEE